MLRLPTFLLSFALCVGLPTAAEAWLDTTHQAMTEAAGAHDAACASIVPDAIVKLRPSGDELPNHFYNGLDIFTLTAAQVEEQATLYSHPDPMGHLYGAALAALRAAVDVKRRGAYQVYFRGALAHYVGDLVQPLHNSPFDGFNKEYHGAVDAIVDTDPDIVPRIRAEMVAIQVHSEREAIAEIVRLARLAAAADARMREGAGLSKSGAYVLLGQGASVLKAMFAWIDHV